MDQMKHHYTLSSVNMKFSSLLISLMFICKAYCADNSVLGINWSPFHDPSYDSDLEANVTGVIDKDYAAIAASGFTRVKTFYSKHGSYNDGAGAQLASYAQQYGLTLALGVYMYTEEDSLQNQIKAAAEQAYEYPDAIEAIFMGNENVRCSEDDEQDDFTAEELLDYIQQMRDALAEYGITDLPVGTVQRYSEWNSGCNDFQEIAEAIDVIGANIYPFYVDSLETIDENLDKFQDMVDNVVAYFPDKPLWITETGYSSGGANCSSEQAPGSVEETEEYFLGMKDWANVNADYDVSYFQYFEKETEEFQDDVCNNFFGLCTAEGEPKFEF